MRLFTTSVLISALALGACGTIRDSAVNPANWFGNGSSAPAPTTKTESTNPLLPAENTGLFSKKRGQDAIYQGKPIDQITKLFIERVPGGAVIRATGITAKQGVHSVRLTPATEDETPVDGVLTYRLEGIDSTFAQNVGSAHTRTVVAARALTTQQLASVGTIRVEAARNAQSSRRR